MGDNQVVITWLRTRQAKHPMATYMLQFLATLEATCGFSLHPSYVRTYHNKVADALTRQDPQQVMAEAGLKAMEHANSCLQQFLSRGWQKRALISAGQADADRNQALRVAEGKQITPIPDSVAPLATALEFSILEIGDRPRRYEEVFLSRGAMLCNGTDVDISTT